MATELDIVLIGSSPFALVLSGLLARTHDKRVAVIGEVPSPLRIDRGLDLSVGAITRPETWMLLDRTVPETSRELAQIGRGVVARAKAAIYADRPSTVIGLQHVQNMAHGFGHAVERQPIAPGLQAAFTFRDVRVLRRGAFNAAIGAWLDACGVLRLPPRQQDVVFRRDGSVGVNGSAGAMNAALGILADDAALLSHIEPEERDPVLAEVEAVAMFTAPGPRMLHPVALYPDRGVALRQHSSRAISAIIEGPPASAACSLGASLPPGTQSRRAGEAVFRTMRTTDGAPLVGRMRGAKVMVIAGLGPTALFQVTALARVICGTASETEVAYFLAREPGRGADRSQVAEFIVPSGSEMVA